MEKFINLKSENWLNLITSTNHFIFQSAIFTIIIITSFFLTKWAKRKIKNFFQRQQDKPWYHQFWPIIKELLFPFLAFLLLAFYLILAEFLSLPENRLIELSQHLFFVWIIATLIGFLLGRPRKWFGYLKLIILIFATLSFFGFLNGITDALKDVSISLGEVRLSFYSLFKSIGLLILFLWLAVALSNLLEKALDQNANMSPSLKVLLVKITRFFLITIAIIMALDATGINLTALTFFGGAIGVGIGFGLRDIIANFIGGIMILSDHSIKPGDVIGVSGTYGWVNKLSARYISVITRDGREHLIPNSHIINEKVENWSFTNSRVRVRIPIGISYKSDPNKAIELIKEAAKETPRVLQNPAPTCYIRKFGDSAIELELRLWISDPANGMGSIQHATLLSIWNKFKKHKIILPFPQRDVHLYEGDTFAPPHSNKNQKKTLKTS